MTRRWLLAVGLVVAFATFAAAQSPEKVPPGTVKWHADFDAACRAAKESGKPVLLFHVLGRLDEPFT